MLSDGCPECQKLTGGCARHSSFTVTVGPEPQPYTCPVCSGRGKVPHGFYSEIYFTTAGNLFTPERCRSCEGAGVIWK